MPENDPPRIRDERRDPDLTRIKERMAVVEKQADRTEKLATGMHFALFGLAEDPTNNGLVGTIADVKKAVQDGQRALNRIFVTVCVGVLFEIGIRLAIH